MSNITSYLPTADQSTRHNSLSDSRSAGYLKEQSLKTHESLDTGVVIETKEGDKVTLTSSSFNDMEAYLYDSKGMVQSAEGMAFFAEHQREITLKSGQAFSFSVEGDLSEEELEDIEEILKGLDEVIEEMAEGDMEEALEKALEIGNHDTISSYAADIRYERSVEVQTTVAATAYGNLPAGGDPAAEEIQANKPLPPEESKPPEQLEKPQIGFDPFLQKMRKLVDHLENRQLDLIKRPVEKLFAHHLEKIEKEDDESKPIQGPFKVDREEIHSIFEEMVDKILEPHESEAEEDDDYDD